MRRFFFFLRDVSFIHMELFLFFLTRTINLWNWIRYHPDNIDINARHTQKRERKGWDAGYRFHNKQKTVAVKKKEVKRQARADNHYPPTIINSLLVQGDRVTNQHPENLIKERKEESDVCAGWGDGAHIICSSVAHSIMKHFIIWQCWEE